MDEARVELVEVAGLKYTHDAFVEEFNRAFLETLEERVGSAQTTRGACRALRDLRSEGAHRVVLETALTRLLERTPFEGDGDIYATFPRPVDKRVAAE